MQTTNTSLAHFIESFAYHSASRNFSAVVDLFAEIFLAAGPAGAQCVRAADFARALPRRAEMFASLGCEPAELIRVEPTDIDGRYALVRTTWRFTLRLAEGQSETINSESIFLVDTGGQTFRILAYINPRDILETLRQRGASA